MKSLLEQLKPGFPDITFVSAEAFCWSPNNLQVRYVDNGSDVSCWSLLHELGHASLGHKSYNSDLELLILEVAAWAEAKKIASKYGIKIDPDHIEDCVDTYRDWLDARSTCPQCTNNGLQTDSERYNCINCQASWKVTSSRFCRPYRLTKFKDKKSRHQEIPEATFI